MNYTNAVVFINGDKGNPTHINKYITENTLLIGCDGGTDTMLKHHLIPDVIIGDFDSFKVNAKKYQLLISTKFIQYPTDKDSTDSELAIQYAVDEGIKQIFITNVLGTRIDHFLGNVFLLNNPKFGQSKVICIENNQEIYAIENNWQTKAKIGETISFLPIFGPVKIERSSGLKYRLEDYVLSMYGNQGMSNVVTNSKINIKLSSGKLLVVHERSY